MKKNFIILFLLCLILGSGCKKGFIDLAPTSDLNAKNFYKTGSDMEQAVNAAYASLRSSGMFNSCFYLFGEMRSDNTAFTWLPGNSFETSSINDFLMTSANPNLQTMWNDTYNCILRCNIVLDHINDIDMDQTQKNHFSGEVSFIRGLTYFYLVRVFGGVPLAEKEITVPESYQLGRASVQDVYALIIKDFQTAENDLPESYKGTDVGRATQGAAQGMLAKVYLTLKKYDLAKTYLEKVINSGLYDLLPNYADLWDLNHENSKESLFEVQYKKGGTGTGSGFANSFAPKFSGTAVVKVGGGGSINSPTDDMANAYEAGDLRKNISMGWGYINEAGDSVKWKYIKKYMDVPFEAGDADNNWPVLRYADILLMYAEVLNELGFEPNGKAFKYLNEIRSRAGLPPKTADNSNPKYKVSNQQEFRLAIEHERRVELAFEDHRWFDLLRTDRAIPVMTSKGYNVSKKNLLFPIPLQVIESNPDKITQNPGY